MARGHHFRPAEAHMGDKAMRADGGRTDTTKIKSRIPEESGEMERRTPANNVENEAEGEERKAGGKVKRARGGAMKHVEMDSEKHKHRRLDRPGRKRGGGVGADMTPLTTAARTRQAEAHKADGDELQEG